MLIEVMMVLLLQISKSSVCVEAMSNCDCVAPLQKAMKLRKDLLSTTCETFNRMFSSNHDSLVSQVRTMMRIRIA